jgi:hypothetical protein
MITSRHSNPWSGSGTGTLEKVGPGSGVLDLISVVTEGSGLSTSASLFLAEGIPGGRLVVELVGT